MGGREATATVKCDVQLRRIPYPYRAMLAICSDLDETPDRRMYCGIMRFLNTTETTAMGPGAGLEAGDSIYFDMPPDQFAYWNTDDAGREMVRTLIRSGHIDCLHSYGDLATTRAHAGRALDELNRHGCRLEVWVDHAAAPTNFGADTMQGHGDEPGHHAYHSDLTTGQGVRYVWRGRVTSVIGQDVSPSLGGLFDARQPLRSAKTVAKEAAKRVLARTGSRKYAMHGHNRLMSKAKLRDGALVYEFLRCNPHCGGVSSCDTGREIDRVLTDAMLERLADREGACVLYTHLGKIRDPREPLGSSAVAAFHRLAEAQRRGRILVTTTRRLLGYWQAIRELSYTVSHDEAGLRIEVQTAAGVHTGNGGADPRDLDGLTFYVDEPERTRLTINGKYVPNVRRNVPDHTGRKSVSLPWRRLEFPEL